MAKHAASDSEGEATSPKRARTSANGASSQPGSSPPPLPNGKSQTQDDSDDEDEMDVEEDEEEHARHTQAVKAMHKNSKSTGSIAQCGIIEQVHLENFMSHKLTTVNFGPQINFIVGMNGSGKSAILTGITMALGGNAKLTNRASKGSGFVREGSVSAKATVKLRNKGTDAFMHHIYGDSITVERTLRAKGGGSYKLMNSEGVTIDTKKHTLDAMLDHFNIQVDNPMTVLSQDQSRQFLSSATAKDKYQFFLRGTQLQQLTEEYEQIRSNTEAMEEALERKKEVLPELKDAYRRAKERAKDATAAIDQQEKVDRMKEELAWSYVDEVEDSIKRGEAMVEREERLGPKIQHELEKFEVTKSQAEEEIGQYEEASAESNDTIEKLTPEATELGEQIKAMRSKTAKFKDEERKISASLARMRETIADFDKRIDAEKKKLDRDIKAEQQPILDTIERLNDEVAKVNSNIVRARHELEDLDDKYRETMPALDNAKDKIQNAQDAANKVQEQIRNLDRAKGNALFSYGQGIPNFLKAIDQERSWREKPIGPIGQHVKLKDRRYASCLESFFERTLNGFIVTSEQDRVLLSKLHRQHRLGPDVPVFTVRPDASIFNDVARGEPHPDVLTVRRALVFANPLIEQVLITGKAIERSALVLSRALGDELLRTNPHNVNDAFSAELFKISSRGGFSSTNTMTAWKGTPRFELDVAGQTRALQEQLSVVNRDVANLAQEKAEVDQRLAQLYNDKQAAAHTVKSGQAKIHSLNRQIDAESSKLRKDEPTNIAAIEESRKEVHDELNMMLEQYQAGVDERARENLDYAPAVSRKHALDDDIAAATKLLAKLSKKAEEAITNRVNAQSAIEQYTQKLNAHRSKVEEMQRQVDALRPDLKLRIEQAGSICERPEVTKKKSTARLQQEIEALLKALKDRERKQGASVEQVMTELATRKKTVDEALKATNDLSKLVKALGVAYNARIVRWADFRDQISSRAKLQFLFHLANRGYTGKLTFDHDKNNLYVRVQTDEGKKKLTKDSKSLSGGEKTFSTICLLLTMWEAVGCPLRCLDEFDVFMDAVNRRISMKMLVDTAKAANGVQFILITPQDMGSAAHGPEVRISKLHDPDRNQGTLAMGR